MSAAAPRKLTRGERNEQTRRQLFAAAAAVVGELGYAEASIARITERAGVAQGTFYNHFASRQALFDELLPALGREMVHFIQERAEVVGPEAAREVARFRAFFEFLRKKPGFLRILDEAEFAAPEAFRRHIENVAAPFQRILIRARHRGELRDYSDAELEVVVHMLMGARSYLGQRFDSADPLDETVASAYEKLLTGGLFND